MVCAVHGLCWIVLLKGKGVPSTAFFPPLCWNVSVKPRAGAALLDHEIETIHTGGQSNQIEEPGALDGCQVVILACPEICRTGKLVQFRPLLSLSTIASELFSLLINTILILEHLDNRILPQKREKNLVIILSPRVSCC